MEGRRRHYDHSNWSPGSGRTWTYSSGDTSEQCATFMEAVNCSSVEDIKDDNLREEVQLWLQRFASLQVVGKSIENGKSPVAATDQPPRVAQIPLEFDPPRIKRWSADDEALRQYLIDRLAESIRLEEWITSEDSCQHIEAASSANTTSGGGGGDENPFDRPSRRVSDTSRTTLVGDDRRTSQSLDRRRLSSQLSEVFHIFARTTDLPRIVTTTTNLQY